MEKPDYHSSLGPEAKVWVSEQEKTIRISLLIWLGCFISAIIIPIAIFMIFSDPVKVSQWIQRVGSVVLVFAILAEIKGQTVRRSIFVVSSYRLYCELYIQNKYQFLAPIVQYSTYLLVAIGTLMTGYGDLMYEEFLKWMLREH